MCKGSGETLRDGGGDRARGGSGQRVRGRAGRGDLAPAAPRSHGDSPWPGPGSCSMTHWTIQSQELGTLSEPLRPLKCRFPPGGAGSTLLLVSYLQQQAGHRCPKDEGMHRKRVKSHSTQEARARVHPRHPPPQRRRGPSLSLPHTCRTPLQRMCQEGPLEGAQTWLAWQPGSQPPHLNQIFVLEKDTFLIKTRETASILSSH